MSCRNRRTQEESVRPMRGNSDDSAAIWHYTYSKTHLMKDTNSHFLTSGGPEPVCVLREPFVVGAVWSSRLYVLSIDDEMNFKGIRDLTRRADKPSIL